MERNKLPLILLTLLALQIHQSSCGGFIVYCPCMGRFGNQAEQLLGSLLFAKLLNRTLVLPPFISYDLNHTPDLIPFENILQIDPIREYHDVMLLSDFVNSSEAKEVWPPGRRRIYCHSPRNTQSGPHKCEALKGQPFETFWGSLNITEDGNTFYKPLTTNPRHASAWRELYPEDEHPVLTFVGAPSSFPTHRDSIGIQKYIKLASFVEQAAEEFKRRNNFSGKPYLSMHVRQGPDWKKACDLLKGDDGLTQLFSSNQCTGYPEKGQTLQEKLDLDTCLPTHKTIIKTLGSSLEGRQIDTVHIATDLDNPTLWKQLEDEYPQLNFVKGSTESNSILTAMIDIYLMTNADVFIGNCVSSFSAFPARMRTHGDGNTPSTIFYYNYDLNGSNKGSVHSDEL